MSGVSPVGVAANGTRSGNESCDLVFMRLVFSNLLPCLPLLATDFPPVATRMEALTPQPSASQVCTPLRSPCLSRLNFRTFRLQTPSCHFATLGFPRYGSFHRRRRRTTPAAFSRHPESGHIVGPCAVRGSRVARTLPDRLGRIKFTCVTDCSFDP